MLRKKENINLGRATYEEKYSSTNRVDLNVLLRKAKEKKNQDNITNLRIISAVVLLAVVVVLFISF